MLDELNSPPQRRKPIDPPLVAMIGVLSMLIMFLVTGSIFGAATIDLPSPYDLAVGHRRNEVTQSPQVIFVSGGFRVSFGDHTEYPLDLFTKKDARRSALYKKLAGEIQSLKRSQQGFEADLPLNVVAERTSSYRTLFDVLSGLREMGFTSLLFVSRLEEGVE